MKQKKLVTAVALMGTLFLLAGCDEGDDVQVDLGAGGSGSTGGGTGVTAPDNCPAFATPTVASDRALCAISGQIMENRTLSSNIDWLLDGSVRVGNGDVELAAVADAANVTLTIEAGTDIFASGDSLLKITRGSNIEAVGTESSPITFSSIDQGEEGSGEWGAVIIQGFAVTNENQGAVPNVDLEAGLGFYAGTDNTDDSGTMQFVRIAEGGIEIAPDEEINGLTLAGVGSGTTIDHIQVQGGLDDGIEIFGGAVNMKNLVLTNLEDDAFDLDLGWQGNAQFVLITRGAVADGGIESDNNGSDFDATPRTRPALANFTILGQAGNGQGALHREGMGVFLHNSIFSGGDLCLDVDDRATEITNGELVYNNVLFNCTANTAGDDDDGAGNEFADQVVAAGGVSTVDPQLNADFVPSASEAQLGAAVDFTTVPVTGSPNTATSFLEPTDYLGAVNPDGSDLWFQGWTLPGTL